MKGSLFCGILLLLTSSAELQEECKDLCAKSSDDPKKVAACKEGCRLQVILAFTAKGDVASTREECHNGCEKSYTNETLAEMCSNGCDHQPEMKNAKSIQIAISNKDPTFDVARNAMDKMMTDIRRPFGFMRGMGALFDSEEDPWADFHRRMHHEMMRFHQIADNLLNLQNAQNILPNVAIHRPQGHEDKALEGPQVGNKDNSGEAIIAAAPVEPKASTQLWAYQDENQVIVEPTESSFVSRLAARARRLSVLNQWLLTAAMVPLLLTMIAVSIAIVKRIRSQRYSNLRNVAVIVPQTLAEALPAKKVPLETPPANIDFPLIHDTPPPAYDQLSVHKEKPDAGSEADPKV